jgi:hypothetical protein
VSAIKIEREDQVVFDRLRSSGRISHELRHLMTVQWNACCVCRREVPEARPAFAAGYDSSGAPVFVGSCCGDRLAELATPVYWTGTLNLAVYDAQPLWRYMDFAKFTSMLLQRGLYFSRLDRLGDPFEGAAGLASRESQWGSALSQFLPRR